MEPLQKTRQKEVKTRRATQLQKYTTTRIKIFFNIMLIFLFWLISCQLAFSIEVKSLYFQGDVKKTKLTQSKDNVYFSCNQFIFKISKSHPIEQITLSKLFSEYYDNVVDFVVDKSETLWVGTYFGLYYNTSSKDIKNFYNETFIDVGNIFYSIELDSNNSVWLSTNKGIWTIKDMKAVQIFKFLDNNIPDTIRKIVIDPFNRKLFVADTCYYRYNDTNITKFSLPVLKNFDCREINNISFNQLGALSISTNCGLLMENEKDSQTFHLYNKKNGDLTNDKVNCSCSDSAYTYIGKGDFLEYGKQAGLTVGKNHYTKTFSYTIPFMELFIYENIENMIIDQYGNVWFNTHSYNQLEWFHTHVFYVMNLNQIKFTQILENDNTSLILSPNPVTEKLTLINIPDNATEFEIYDQFGNRQIAGLISGQIDVSLLPAGVYFLKLNNSQSPLKFLKI